MQDKEKIVINININDILKSSFNIRGGGSLSTSAGGGGISDFKDKNITLNINIGG